VGACRQRLRFADHAEWSQSRTQPCRRSLVASA
jgi:hypothetical protein